MAEARQRWAARIEAAWSARGPLPCALWPASLLFGRAVALRRALYRVGWLAAHRLPVPVVVVGNLVAGGAGKTPTTLAIVALLRRRGFTPGIVSRGYGRRGDSLVDVQPDTPVSRCGDEPLLLRLRSGAPVVVARDRVAAARELLRMNAAVDIVVSDDGLQHLSLARSAQVLVFDERGVANGWLLPAGPLREPLPGRVPPATIVLYNAAAPTTPLPGHLAHGSLAGVVPLADWWHGGATSSLAALRALRALPLLAAAGVARPERFFALLRAAGLRFVELPLPDHATFDTPPWPLGTPDVVVTEKDAVKLVPADMGATRVWVARLDFEFDAGFAAALTALLGAPARNDEAHGSQTA